MPKFDWKDRKRAYCVGISHTNEYIGFYGNESRVLGKRAEILNVGNPRYGGSYKQIRCRFKGRVTYTLHSSDLSTKNTWKDPMGALPEFMKKIGGAMGSTNHSYRCLWVMYSPKKGADWMGLSLGDRYEHLEEYFKSIREPCRACNKRYNCFDKKKCKDHIKFLKPDKDAIVGADTNNHACWASVMGQWRDIHRQFKVHPKRLLAKVRGGDRALSTEDTINFLKYMKQAKCLPAYFEIPEPVGDNDSMYFEFKLNKVNPPRLFWYLCVIRNIAEKPGIPKLTNFFIEKGGVDPLVAYALGHIMLRSNSGGHTSISDCPDYRVGRGSMGSVPMPNIPKTTHFILQLHKFLTSKTCDYVTDKDVFNAWYCSGHTQRVDVAEMEDKLQTLEELLRFIPKTRKLKEI